MLLDDTDSGNKNTSMARSLTTDSVHTAAAKQMNKTKSLVFTPYNKIMEDVMFVISGIQNPERQELKELASGMGAHYLPDWIESATHLICPFSNTPKFVLAQKAGGTIVSPKWIYDCNETKTRLPDEDYLLEPTPKKANLKSTMGSMRDWLSKLKIPKKSQDQSPTQSDSEPASPIVTTIQNARITRGNSNSPLLDEFKDKDDASDTTEPLSDTSHTNDILSPAKTTNKHSKETTQKILNDMANNSPNKKIKLNNGTPKSNNNPLGDLPNYFNGVRATLFGSFDAALKSLIYRYVTAYSGDVEDKVDHKTTHIVTNQLWNEELQSLKDQYPVVKIVRPSWVFDCHNEQRTVDVAPHLVLE